MKEVVAIIRMNKLQKTKAALADEGFPAFTVFPVLGRGRQRGFLHEYTHPIPAEKEPTAKRFIPKRMIIMAVKDKDVDKVVEIIMAINRTGNPGDGKVFIGDVKEAVRIRTQEKGEEAIV